MTRSPTHNAGPVRNSCSPRQQARPHTRRRGNEASSTPGDRRAPAPGNHLGWLAPVLLTALVLAHALRARRRRPAPAIHRLAAADELRFAWLCHRITHTRQGVST